MTQLNVEYSVIKQVGGNGQISLGKQYAGKQVQISKLEDGALIIRLGKFIPDNEMWLYEDNNLAKMNQAVEWTESNPRRENFDQIANMIQDV
jgi:hypothetical protein